IVASRDSESDLDFVLEEGDLLRAGDHELSRFWKEGSERWLLVPIGAQVFRANQPMVGRGGYTRTGFVKVQDGEKLLLRRYSPADSGPNITVLSAYGEPWIVEHDQVVVRRGPSTSDLPMGILLKGDVAGVRRRRGDWVELMQDSEVRFRRKLESGVTASDICAVNALRRHKALGGVEEPRTRLGLQRTTAARIQRAQRPG
ncbi:unnamed protein product, partial [Polarella glacialis]